MTLNCFNRLFKGLLLISLFLNPLRADLKEIEDLINEMIFQVKSVKSLYYNTASKERIDGSIIERGGIFKMIVSPPRVYYERLFPEKGAIVIYDSLKMGEKIQVKPHTFPWVPLNLHKDDWIVRKSGHHTPDRAGYGYTLGIFEALLKKHENDLDEMLHFGEEQQYDGKMCQIIRLENPHFRWQAYTVKEGESLISIAKERHLSEYMIYDRNADLKNFTDIKAGQIIQIPTDYAAVMDIWIDKESMLPIKFTIYDDRGLFEEFGYKDIKINIPLDDNDFKIPK
jgi:hypothetical protein